MKERKIKLEVSRNLTRMHTLRNIATTMFFLVVVASLCIFLGYMQNRSSELIQKENSNKILDEITATLRDNSRTVDVIEDEFDSMNQNLIITLANYMVYTDLLPQAKKADYSDPAVAGQITQELSSRFEEIKQSVNAGAIYLLGEDGTVLVSNDPKYIGRNMKEAFPDDDISGLFNYKVSSHGVVMSNGTQILDKNGDKVAAHVRTGDYYTYSTMLWQDETGYRYFLLTSVPTELLESEASGLKQIGNILKGITVGKAGFLFAIDKEAGTFIYFNNGEQDLTGEKYNEYGLSQKAEADNYAGYETIDGTSYYCVTKEFQSSAFGEYTIIAAAERKTSLLGKNFTTVSFSAIVFVILSALIVSYALILRRDIANKTIELKTRFINDYKDDIQDGKYTYTEEEIMERAEICLTDAIVRQTDKRFKRINIGSRSRRGAQAYLSLFTIGRLIPVAVIGLVFVFGISFFSQTLMALEDVTTLSETSIGDIPLVMTQATATKNAIQTYVDDQYESTAKLISFIFEDTPAGVFDMDIEDSSTFRVFDRDEEGNRIYAKDMYGNQKYAVANSNNLQTICDDNSLEVMYVIDEEGYTIATNTNNWYFRLSKETEDRSYAFWDVIDGKVQTLAQDPTETNDSEVVSQFIGNAFNYYTYLSEDGETIYADKDTYASYLNGEWEGPEITKHRGLVQIGIDRAEMANLFMITNLDYVLKGLHIYGSNSFFMAFDTNDDHTVLYSPYKTSIGKTSTAIGLTENAFSGNFNGFQKINGVKYYQSIRLVGDIYVATAIPVNSLYGARNAIAGYTLLFSAIFILGISILYSISTDKMDDSYSRFIQSKYHETGYKSSTFYITTPSGRKKKTSSAASRYSKIRWNDKSPEQKLSALILAGMTVASVLIVATLIYAMSSNSGNSIFTYIFQGNWDRGWNIFAITEAIMIMLIIMTVTKLVQISVRSFCGALGARVETTGNLLVSVLKYGGLIGGGFYCLHLFGFNTTSLITSAGILSVVVGLGAQSLISDIIAGIFIVFEGEFRVGDIVTIGDFRGSVLEIGLRTSKIEDATKNIKIFNNSEISGVINMTKESSFAMIIVGIEYGESLERVEQVLHRAFPKIKKKLPAITDGPFYQGVQELGNNSVDLRIVAQCEEKDRLQLVRDLYREVYLVFNRNHISVPFPQVTLSYLDDKSNEAEKNPVEANKSSDAQWVDLSKSNKKKDEKN